MTYLQRELKRRSMGNSADLRGTRRLSILCDFVCKTTKEVEIRISFLKGFAIILCPGNLLQSKLYEFTKEVLQLAFPRE